MRTLGFVDKFATLAVAMGVAVGAETARAEATATKGGSAKAYIQDGLVAQYDAIENAGYGLHDDAATSWKDLIGNGGDMTMTNLSNVAWTSNSVTFLANWNKYDLCTTNVLNLGSDFTFQIFVNSGTYQNCRRWDVVTYTSNYESWANSNEGFLERLKGSSATSRISLGPWRNTTDIIFTTRLSSEEKKHLFRLVPIGGDAQSTSTTIGTCAMNYQLQFFKGSAANSPKYAIRIYNRKLTDDEVVHNEYIDQLRFKTADADRYRWNDGKVESYISATANGPGTVAIGDGALVASTSEWHQVNTQITLTATPNAGKYFYRWEGETNGFTVAQTTSSTLTFEHIQPRNLTAVFRTPGDSIHHIPADFETLAKALASDTVMDGDTIYMADGTYVDGGEQVYEESMGRWYHAVVNKAVTIIGSSPTNVIIDCGGNGGLYINNAATVLSGVTITNFQRTAVSSALYMPAGTISNVVINGGGVNLIENGKYSVYVGPGALVTDCEICKISMNRWDTSECPVYVAGATIRRTIVHGQSGVHRVIKTYPPSGRRSRFEDCKIINNYDCYNPMIQGENYDAVRCVFYGNRNSGYDDGIRWSGRTTMLDCIITNNSCNGDSALISCNSSSSAYVTNCLIANNKIEKLGVIKVGLCNASGSSARIELVNTTVANNKTSAGTYCGGFTGDGTSNGPSKVVLINTVVWNNTANGVVKDFGDYLYTTFHCTNSCFKGLTPATGVGNVAADPCFTAADEGDFTLGEGSSCVDAGADLPAVATDITGKARPIDGTGGDNPKWDVGCYEADAREIPLQCAIKALGSEGVWPCPMTQTVSVIGAKLTGLTYEWWAIYDEGGVTKTNVQYTTKAENVFENQPIGNYSFVCIVRNDQGNAATSGVENAFKTLVSTCYVSASGSDTFPYTNATMAAHDLKSAIDMATTKIYIAPGEYKFSHYSDSDTGYDCVGSILRAVEVVGGETAEDVIIDCDGKGGMVLANAGASLCGITFKNYRTALNVPTLYLKYGSASNIVISGSHVSFPGNDSDSANVYIGENARIDNLVVTNQRCAAVSVVGGSLRNAYIADCWAYNKNIVAGDKSSHDLRSSFENLRVERNETRTSYMVYLRFSSLDYAYIADNTNINNNSSIVMLLSGDICNARVVRNRSLRTICGNCTWSNYKQLVRNCLVADNVCGNAAAVELVYGSAYLNVENSTIVSNVCGNAAAGGVSGVDNEYTSHLTIINSIIWGNTANGEPSDVSDTANDKKYSYSCFREAENYPNSHNIALDPRLKKNYKLKGLSPCHESGSNQTWHETGIDLDGAPRLMWEGKTVDMGCFEGKLSPGLMILTK